MDRCVSTLWLRRHDWMRKFQPDLQPGKRNTGWVYWECDRCGAERGHVRGELWFGRPRTDFEIAFEDGLDKWLLGISPADTPLLGGLRSAITDNEPR